MPELKTIFLFYLMSSVYYAGLYAGISEELRNEKNSPIRRIFHDALVVILAFLWPVILISKLITYLIGKD